MISYDSKRNPLPNTHSPFPNFDKVNLTIRTKPPSLFTLESINSLYDTSTPTTIEYTRTSTPNKEHTPPHFQFSKGPFKFFQPTNSPNPLKRTRWKPSSLPETLHTIRTHQFYCTQLHLPIYKTIPSEHPTNHQLTTSSPHQSLSK